MLTDHKHHDNEMFDDVHTTLQQQVEVVLSTFNEVGSFKEMDLANIKQMTSNANLTVINAYNKAVELLNIAKDTQLRHNMKIYSDAK